MKKEMHIVLPTSTQGKSNLYFAMRKKIQFDGSTGECAGIIITQEIDLNVDYTGTLNAITHETNQGVLFRLGEINNAEADKVLDLIQEVVRGIGGELTSLYKPDRTHKIAYGFDLSPTGATTFPTTDEGWKTLFYSIFTQYNILALSGPVDIDPYLLIQHWVLSDLKIALDAAIAQKIVAAQNHRDSETETQEKNADLALPEINIHKIVDFLHGRHMVDARLLGAYGITTSDAPPIDREQISTAPISIARKIQHITFGSLMVNMTADPLTVYKGRTIRGAGVIIPGFGQLAMTKGYSNAIIVGSSIIKPAIVRVTVAR